MTPHFYEASVPVFERYLERLSGLVSLAEAHEKVGGPGTHDVLSERLAPNMLPFHAQVEIAANFSLRTCFPLAGEAVPPYGDFPATAEGLRARLTRALALIRALRTEQFEEARSRVIQDAAGQAELRLTAPTFLYQYALPNFFFHVAMAYAILRSQGVALGKEQFDGFHAYPRLVPEVE